MAAVRDEYGARRADPRNGRCLHAVHDRALDRGLVMFDEDLSILVPPASHDLDASGERAAVLASYAGRKLHVPGRFTPDPA